MRLGVSVFLILLLAQFSVVFLLIADRENDDWWLYLLQFLIAVMLLMNAWMLVSGRSLKQMFRNSQEAVILEQGPFGYAVIDLCSKKVLTSSVGFGESIHGQCISLENWLQMLSEQDRSSIERAVSTMSQENWKYGGVFSKSGNMFSYRCLIEHESSDKPVLYIWIIEETGRIKQEQEMVSLLDHYRLAAYEMFSMFNALPFAVWQEDIDGTVQYHNRKFLELSQTLNQNLGDVVPTKGFMYRYLAEDEKAIVVSIKRYGIPYYNGVIACGYDCTEEDMLLKRVNLLQGIVDNLTQHNLVATLILDSDLKVLHFNMAFLQLFVLGIESLQPYVSYRHLFDALRDNHRLPELKGFKEKHFSDITANYKVTQDLWHLASGTTIRVTIIPSSENSTIITYQDITPNLEILRSLNCAKSMFSAVAKMIEYPLVIISQNGRVSFMTEDFVEAFLRNKNVIPLSVAELFLEENLRIKAFDIEAILRMVASALQSVATVPYFFKIGNVQYIAESKNLDDLSVVLTIHPLSWYQERAKKICPE